MYLSIRFGYVAKMQVCVYRSLNRHIAAAYRQSVDKAFQSRHKQPSTFHFLFFCILPRPILFRFNFAASLVSILVTFVVRPLTPPQPLLESRVSSVSPPACLRITSSAPRLAPASTARVRLKPAQICSKKKINGMEIFAVEKPSDMQRRQSSMVPARLGSRPLRRIAERSRWDFIRQFKKASALDIYLLQTMLLCRPF